MTTRSERRRRPYAARVPLAERREQLMDAALVIINRDGYAALSIAGVAAEAGVTRPVVYGAFADLDALSTALLDRTQRRAVDQVMGVLQPLLDGSTDIEGWAATHLRELIGIVRADRDTWRPILVHLPGTPAEVTERIGVTRDAIRSVLAGIIAEVGRSSIDPVVGSHLLLGAVEELGRQLLVEPPALDVDTTVESVGVVLAALVETAPRAS